jgi:mRNA interferase MazF
MPKGNIVLIPFPYTDLTGSKLRPELVLTENALDVTVSFITTQLQWQEPTDITLQPQNSNGIKKASIIRLSKLATIDRSLIIGIIGNLDQMQIAEVNTKLKMIFQLP